MASASSNATSVDVVSANVAHRGPSGGQARRGVLDDEAAGRIHAEPARGL